MTDDVTQPTADTSGGGLIRCRLDLAYDGSCFSGWASQPGQQTVEGDLTAALRTILRAENVSLTVAGRTDSGVHAQGQVAHVDIPRQAWQAVPGRSDRTPDVALVTRLAGMLPKSIVVRQATVVTADFDARFSALSRRYRYRLADTVAARSPTRRVDVTWLQPRLLDESAMDQAAQLLLGEHDWLPYCRPREGATTVRTLQRYTWWRDDSGLLVGEVVADAFCHHMVRALVGACVFVGAGRRAVTWPKQVLDAGVRDSAVQVMPADGLTLEEVRYPETADEWAAQSHATKRRRVLPDCAPETPQP